MALSEAPTSLDQFARRAGQLYTLPRVAAQVLQLTAEEQVDLHKLRECLECDPALVGKVLRVVNSSLFGLSREVADLGQALALLGIKPLKLLVLGFSLPDALFKDVAGPVLVRYWQHALIKAVAARQISETVWRLPGDEAFLAGLLQDIGMLVLLQELGEAYAQFLERVHAEGAALAEMERRLLGFEHTQLSARLLAQWQLPAALIEAVPLARSSAALEAIPPSRRALPQILQLGELVALVLSGRAELLRELLDAGRRYHNLTLEQLEGLVQSLQSQVAQLADIFSLELPEGDYAALLAEAHRQLSPVAAEAALELLQRAAGAGASQQNWLDTEENLELKAALQSWWSAEHRSGAEPDAVGTERATSGGIAERGGGFLLPAPAALHAAVAPLEPDARLLNRLTVAIAVCRQRRAPVSLMLVELDGYAELVATLGLSAAGEWVRRVERICRRLDQPGLRRLTIGDGRWALILPNCDRGLAVQFAKQLLATARSWQRAEQDPEVTLSIGIAALAVPPRNFPAQELIARADRCLAGARASGGNGLKSVEL